jgi:hypothetical protein
MSENTLTDRIFHGTIVLLFLALGSILVIDSIKRRGYQFGSSAYIFYLGIGLALSFVAIVRDRNSTRSDEPDRSQDDSDEESNDHDVENESGEIADPIDRVP